MFVELSRMDLKINWRHLSDAPRENELLLPHLYSGQLAAVEVSISSAGLDGLPRGAGLRTSSQWKQLHILITAEGEEEGTLFITLWSSKLRLEVQLLCRPWEEQQLLGPEVPGLAMEMPLSTSPEPVCGSTLLWLYGHKEVPLPTPDTSSWLSGRCPGKFSSKKGWKERQSCRCIVQVEKENLHLLVIWEKPNELPLAEILLED